MEKKLLKIIVAVVALIISLWAVTNLINSFQTIDRDDDGLSDAEEEALGTNPLDSDSDNDGINDFDENQYWADRKSDEGQDELGPTGDIDGDGTPNIEDTDSDNDGISDGQEIKDGTDPASKDTDDDGVDDGDEPSHGDGGTDPTNPDSDGDGIPDGQDSTPNGPQNPGDLTYGEMDPSDRNRGPDRNGYPCNPTCFAVFDPYLLGKKRYTVQDAITEDYTAYIADQNFYPLSLSSTKYENVFVGTITLELSNDKIAIPSVAPNANIISYTWDDPSQDITLEFFKDGADNYYVESSRTYGTATLIFTTSADSSYFTFNLPDDDKTLSDIPESVKHTPPAAVISKANIVIDELGLTGETNLKTIISTLINYFSDFEPGDIPSESEQPDPYLAMALSQHGCCYSRSFPCFVTANAIGIPTRLVTNECHAFVEMYIPDNGWMEVQLGGCGPCNTCNPDGNDPFDGSTDPVPDDGDDDDDDDQQPSEILLPTNTTISKVDATAYKGDEFTVQGYVKDEQDKGIYNMVVEIFVNKTKNSLGDFAGIGITNLNGYFSIQCKVPGDSEPGVNQILAHAVRNTVYDESWSDPTIEIYSDTTLVLDMVDSVGLGYSLNIAGLLVDEGGLPVSGKTITIEWENSEIGTTTTNMWGSFWFSYTPTVLGSYDIRANFAGEEYYGSSEDSKIIAVKDEGTNLEITVTPTTIKRGDEINIEGELYTGSDTPMKSTTVEIHYQGIKSKTTTTTAQGAFDVTYTIPTSSEIGINIIKAVFPGTELYGSTDDRQTIAVQADTQLTITSPSKTNIEQNETIIVSGTLKDDAGNPVRDMQIDINWSLHDDSIRTNSEGNFNFTYKVPADAKLGTSIITADFAGSGYYLESQGTKQIKIVEPGSDQNAPVESQNTYILLAIAAIIIAIVVGVIMLFKKETKKEGPTIQQIASQTIDNLKTGTDYRKSVLNCYKQMCNWMNGRGIRKAAYQTPREFAMTAKNFLNVSPENLYTLTQIFEKARYSPHDINLQDRDNAIKCLNEILSAPVNMPDNVPAENVGQMNPAERRV